MMADKDIHVLDWSRIIQGHETNIVPPKVETNFALFRGVLFEDLVEALLKAMFPEERWRRTGKSHDGKRDFVFPYEEYLPEKKWAECKNYSTNLSINVLAPTLIMGTLEKIEVIFVFSYSPLNDNAIYSLYNYVTLEKRTVKLFDGNLLESLICQYCHLPSIIAYFPTTDFKSAISRLAKKKYKLIQSVRYPSGTKIEQKHNYELGERFHIHTLIQNMSMDELSCNLSIVSDKCSLLKCDYANRTIVLPAGNIIECVVKCECISFGIVKCKVIVQVGSNKKAKTISIKITDKPYLAWAGQNAWNVLSACMVHLKNLEKKPMIIAGASGTGKSRLLEILISNSEIADRYQILKMDIHASRSNCIQELLFQSIRIDGNDTISVEQKDNDVQIWATMISNYVEHSDALADTILKLYNDCQPFLVVIDDIQEINSSYILLLHTLIYKAEERKIPIHFCFVLNEDVMSINDLVCQLNWDENYQNRDFCLFHLSKYDKTDIVSFFKTQYGLQNIDNLFEAYNHEVSPLELHSFCLRLRKAGIIAKNSEGQIYHITNRFKFDDAIKGILYSTIPFNKICEQIDGKRLSTYVLKYIYIVGYASCNVENFSKKQINSLIELGILKRNQNGLVFYHEQIREAVGKSLCFTDDDYADIFADAETNNFAKAICVLSKIGRIRTGDEFLTEFWDMNHDSVSPKQRFEICKLIVGNIKALSKCHMVFDALRFLRKHLNELNKEQGHSKMMSFYQSLADVALVPCWDIDEQSVDNMAYLVKKYFDRALSTYQYQNCVAYYTKFEKVFGGIYNISEQRRNYWLAHYTNRIAITLDRDTIPWLPEPSAVYEKYNLATKYRLLAGSSPELELQDIVDNFNRHYIYRHDLTEATLKNSILLLQGIDRTVLDRTIILDYHLLLLRYLSYHWNINTKSERYLELRNSVEQLRNNCTSAFYSLKLYVLEIYILIAMNKLVDSHNVLCRAFQFAYKNDMRNSIYRLTYIQTQLKVLHPEEYASLEVCSCALQALEQMIDARSNSVNRMKQEQYLVDGLLKILKTHNSCEVLDSWNDLNNDIRIYLNSTSTDFNCENRKLRSYIYLQDIDWPQI